MVDFTKLQNLYRMFSPVDELVAEKLNIGNDPMRQESLVRQLSRILIDNNGGGATSVEGLRTRLNDLRTNASDVDKAAFNELISFYSNLGGIDGVEFPYMYKDLSSKVNDDIKLHQILGVEEDRLAGKNMSICLSRSAYVSPVGRNADKAEVFLNFMPTVFMSRCVPYLELEFVYDRGYDKNIDGRLATAGLLKFLLGGDQIKAGTADDAMYRARTSVSNDEDPEKKRVYTTAGMEMFTAPQTLINLSPDADANRYIPVLDPMRPFATLESVTINIKGAGAGIFSFKTAQAVIKLHDKSRLSEIADLIQPTTYTRTTIWLTYGWRHPSEPGMGPEDKSYGEFINNNMLLKEAYGISNSSYSFDQTGQVTITLELFTKSAIEARDIKVQDDSEFARIVKEQRELSNAIAELRSALKMDDESGVSKDVRLYAIIDAAANNNFAELKNPQEAQKSIDNLKAAINKPAVPIDPDRKKRLEVLVKGLEKFFKKGTKDFSYKERRSTAVEQIIYSKLHKLSQGLDPFIYFPEKHSKFLEEAGLTGPYPYATSVEKYDDSILRKDDNSTQVKFLVYTNKIVSFGKLFCLFMAPVMLDVDGVDEYQVFFYNINGLAGLASHTNIAEFAIDLPVFMNHYKEFIETNETSVMTVEQFVKLVVDSQFSDHTSIPYGFRNKGLLEPGKEKGDPPVFKEKQKDSIPTIELELNKGRGSLQLPQIEIFLETLILSGEIKGDVLSYYESTEFNKKSNEGGKKKVLRVHVFDKGLNPYREAAKITTDGKSTTVTPPDDEPNNPYQRNNPRTASVTQEKVFNDGTKREEVRQMISRMVPSIIPGMNASSVMDVSLSSTKDALLQSAQMMGMNMGRNVQATPRGAAPGGLPLRVIPAKLSMRTLGCPLVSFAQMFYVDMNTGTTIDNIYGITGITHSLSPGKFETNLDFAFYDAYGKYEPVKNLVEATDELTKLVKEEPKKTEAPAKKTLQKR
jgi:hypothetical protein